MAAKPKVEPVDPAAAGEPPKEVLNELMKLPGVGLETARSLFAKGITSAQDLQGHTVDSLGKVAGFTEEQTKKLLSFVGMEGVVDTTTGTLSSLVQATLGTATAITSTTLDLAGKTVDTAAGVASTAVGTAAGMAGFKADGETSMSEKFLEDLKAVPGITKDQAIQLFRAGYDTTNKIVEATDEQLEKVEGMTTEMAGKVLDFFKGLLEDEEKTE